MNATHGKILEWTPEYALRLAGIDREHQAWFDIVNRLHGAMLAGRGKEFLLATFAQYSRHALHHFAHEEKLMAAANYPGFREHVERHDELRTAARAFGERFERGETTMTIELTLYLSKAIKDQIVAFDLPMGEYLRAHRSAPAPGGSAV